MRPPVHPDDPLAELLHAAQVVADEQHGGPRTLGDLLHALDAFGGEVGVAGPQHLVDNQDLGFDGGRGGEGQAGVHARGVGLDRLVDEVAQLGEFDDLLLLGPNDRRGQALVGQRGPDVVAAAEFGMEAGAQLKQGLNPPINLDVTLGGGHVSGDDLEQGALAGPVAADDPQPLAVGHGQVQLAEGPELLPGVLAPEEQPPQAEGVEDLVRRPAIELVHLAQPGDGDGWLLW